MGGIVRTPREAKRTLGPQGAAEDRYRGHVRRITAWRASWTAYIAAEFCCACGYATPDSWDTWPMSPRSAGSATFSPTSVIVEFHEFGGRWFVTDRWGSGSGIAIKRPIRKSALGKAVLERVEAARSEWRTFVTEAEGAEHWAEFCVSEAGVPGDQYQPEKRLVILAGKTEMRCCDARQSPPRWEPLPAKSPRALGNALLKRIAALEAPSPEPRQTG